jgi:hypothetical protein
MRFILLQCCLFISFASIAQKNVERELVKKMLLSCTALKSAKFTLKSAERLVNGNFSYSELIVKLETVPRKVYLYCVNPNAGTEVLWKQGWIGEKLYISPTGFPYVNIRLSPYSSLVRKDSHHTVYEIGFDYVSEMIQYYQKAYGEKFYTYINIIDTVQWDNHTCYQLSFDFTDFSTYEYTVKTGETITSIATRLHLNDYSLLLYNSSVSDYDEIEQGQVIKVPNFYNRRVDFFIDAITFLPLRQEIYDAKGLYEKYEMKSFLHNPKFNAEEFSTEYAEYKF